MRLDAEKLEILRGWGDGLSNDPRDDVRSAGRAILLLIEEIERLHIDLWHRGVEQSAEQPVATTASDAVPAPADIESTLRGRLARWLP